MTERALMVALKIMIGWWLFWIAVTGAEVLSRHIDAKAGVWDNDELFSDEWWCEMRSPVCHRVEPYILVERLFGRDVGTEFRTEYGCLMALGIALKQKGVEAFCFADKKSAEKFFPALKLVRLGERG